MRSQITAALLALLLVASPISAVAGTGLAGTASGQTTAPDGFVGLPDTNVQEDLPVGTNASLRAHDLEGSVMASSNASSLQVIVTTPDRASGYVNGSAVGGSAGGVVLVFKDDQAHAGRDVAVPAEAIRDATGGLPEVVHGVHEDGSGWSSEVKARNGLLIFHIPKFSANTVTFDGTAQIEARPAQDGSQYSYDVGDPTSVDDFNITVTGSTATEWDNESATAKGDGSTMSLGISGNADPAGPSSSGEPLVEFAGRETLFSESVSGSSASDGDTASFSVNGDADPKNAQVTFTGSSSSSSGSTSATGVGNGGTFSYNVGGNLDASDVSVTFTGRETTSGASSSGTGSGSVSVGGNIAPTGESVSATGRTSTSSKSATGTTSGGTDSISIGGNLDPSGPSNGNPQLTLTGGQTSYNPYGSASSNSPQVLFGQQDSGEYWHVEAYYASPPETVSKLKVHTGGSGTAEVDIYIADGDTTSSSEGSSSITEGTKVADSVTFDGNTETVDISDYTTSGNGITIQYKTVGSGGTYQRIDQNVDSGADKAVRHFNGSPYETLGVPDTELISEPASVSVSASDGTSQSFGSLSNGQSVSKTFDVSRSASSLDFTMTGGQVDYSLDYTERTATVDPSIDVDGDGSDEASWTGKYSSGQSTTSKSVNGLSTGSNSVSTSTNAGPQPDWSLSWTERTATENPAIDVDGDGTTDASYGGVLTSGQTWTTSVQNISEGSHTASVSTSAHSTDVDLSWTEWSVTENPSVDVNGDGVADGSYSGLLYEGETATTSLGNLQTGSVTAEFSLGGPAASWEIAYDRVEHTENPGVDLDGDNTPEAQYAGVLAPGETATAELSGLTYTHDTLFVQTASSTETDVTVRLEERTETVDPTVTINGNTTGGAVGRLADGETAQLQTDSSWIQDGQNDVTVNVGSGTLSSDAPTPQTDLNYTHSAAVQVDATYVSGGWEESYNVSHTYAGDREDATLHVPFSSEIYRITHVERSINGGDWTTVPADSWELQNGTDLTVHLDDNDGDPGVEAGDTVAVRTAGLKVHSDNGQITVTDPTDPTDESLDSGIRVDETSPDFHLEVGGTEYGDRVHNLHSESWDSPEETAVLDASGGQSLYLPNAGAGDTARVTAIPLEVDLDQGDVGIHVVDQDQPTLEISPGPSGMGSDVTYRWYGIKAGEQYGIYSLAQKRYMDKTDASAEYVELLEDDSQEALVIREVNGSSSSTGGSGDQRIGGGNWKGATDEIQLQEIGVLVSWVAGVLLLIAATGRSDLTGQRRWITVAVVSVGSGLGSLELVRPGAVSGAVNSGLSDVIPLAGLAAIGYVGYSLYQWWQTRRNEASTPETQVTLDVGSSDD